MASNSLKNPGKILEFCGCGKVGTLKTGFDFFNSVLAPLFSSQVHVSIFRECCSYPDPSSHRSEERHRSAGATVVLRFRFCNDTSANCRYFQQVSLYILIIDVCKDIYVMMSSDLYRTYRHCLYGTLYKQSSMDVIVTQITTVVFGNVATVTSQLLLHRARRCIGCKWPFQIFSDSFSQKDWYKFGMAKNGHSEFFPTVFPKKTYKFGMAKNVHSEFIQTFLVQKDWEKF